MIPLAAVVAVAALAQPLTPVPFTDVTFTGGFWAERQAVVREATLNANFHQCEITGRIDNLAIAGGSKQGVYSGYFFNDSDVYKAIEGAAYVLATMLDGEKKAALDAKLDGLIATIAAAQQPDGYINSYFQTKDANPAIKDADTKWSNTAVKHEMYCMGHLIEAGVAHYRATRKRSLLDVAVKAADHIDSVFGPPPKRPDVCGHEEIELALIRLLQLGRDDKAAGIKEPERYQKLAEHFIHTRGTSVADRKLYGEYCQDHVPLKDQTEVVGHAVRAMYLFSAATDLALISAIEQASGRGAPITDHRSLITPLETLWTDLTARKMYVTGGIGNSGHNEGFTRPYDLPNESAYAETCATIGLALWAHRMNLLTRDAKYFDVLERALYNGILSGVSLDGSKFFYENPLGSTGDHHRKDWYACACCPPNVLRVLASLGAMAYGTIGGKPGRLPDYVFVNLYAEGTARLRLGVGEVQLTQTTRYPWDGKVRIAIVTPKPNCDFVLCIRRPSWSERPTVLVSEDGRHSFKLENDAIEGNGYTLINGQWSTGAYVEIEFPMPVKRVHAHPSVTFDRGRVALQRGPIVYCLEDADNEDGARSIALPPDAEIEATFQSDLLGGVTVLTGEGLATAPQDWDEGELYRAAPEAKKVRFTAIPYFAWDNREAGGMQVWIPESAALAPLGRLPGVTTSASHCWGSDSVLALTDRQEPASSADHQVPRQSFWPRKGTTEWVQVDFDRPRRLSGLDVYWFDDGPPAGSGNCRVPNAWSVLCRTSHEGDWKPVSDPRRFTTERDTYNRARFWPIEVVAVRVQVELQPGFSAGVLEVRPVK
ncbi:MAG: glycoside hydrolase family 127 protein [Phycisphaerales bacterium]